jgi:1,4-alpha-glucan branching enzyme
MIEKKYFKIKDYVKVKFSVATNGEKVEIVGLNNDWENALLMTKKKDGIFSAEVNLPKDSTHEFKYLVDTKTWLNDAETEAQVANVFGTTNSLVII